tara:strand:- start:399 stop:791 length:393 start_codon:yes stop_codon:yes gene_type:complete
MKELSNVEKDLAPEWAVYFVADGNDVLFVSKCKSRACWLVDDFELECGFDLQDEFDIVGDYENLLEELNLIQKPFDITKHEFSDRDISMATLASDYLCLHLDGKAPYVAHSKKDAIAIAKSLGVTGEDLK